MNKEDYAAFLEESAKMREVFKQEHTEDRENGWLERKTYTCPEEIVKDILYITDKAKEKVLSDSELDMYFYKRKYLQDQLQKFYADKYVLVDDFNKVQGAFNYTTDAEEVISELAGKKGYTVLLKRGDEYFAEVGDETVNLGKWPRKDKVVLEENNDIS